jgi:hypothetical protein
MNVFNPFSIGIYEQENICFPICLLPYSNTLSFVNNKRQDVMGQVCFRWKFNRPIQFTK